MLKIRRSGTPPGKFLVLNDVDKRGRVIATETRDENLREVNNITHVDNATNNYTFSAFQLVSLSRGRWQLQYIMTRGPGLVQDDLPLAAEMPYALGEVHDDGKWFVGLVPLRERDGDAPPNSEILLRQAPAKGAVYIENARGTLCFRKGRYVFSKKRADPFVFERIEDMYNVGVTTPMLFAENPWSKHSEVVPVEEPSPPPRTPPAEPDTLGGLILASGVAMFSACAALAFGKRK